jgi:hypothetical protein
MTMWITRLMPLLVCLMTLSTVTVFAQASVPGETDLSKTDRSAIQQIIATQLKAIEAGDGPAAFALSAPEVRRHFGSADAFIEMVRKNYEALYRNQSTVFLEAAIVEGGVIQPLRIEQRDGMVVIALFSMERQGNGDWRIYGCRLAPSELQAT